MKIVHIVPHINHEASGPSYSVPRLCQAQSGLGHQVSLECLANERVIDGVDVNVYGQWPLFDRFAISHQFARAIRRKVFEVDIIHNHSLWSMVNVATGWLVPGHGARLVVSPRGTLSAWALSHSRHKKQLLWPLQKRILERADLLHATSEEEYQDIRNRGLKAPVLVAPNGIDLPELSPRSQALDKRTLLFLSRIHPVKGLETLIDAWGSLEAMHPDWELKIVGPGDAAYVNTLKGRVDRNGSCRVHFVGALYGLDKEQAYRDADLFVLPSHSENFAMAVAEALSHECPAIVTQGAPWAGLDRDGCGWWIPNSVDSLRNTLNEAMHLPKAELQAMGTKGRLWMERDFSWDAIARMMEDSYQWLIEGGESPACVRL